MALLERFYDPIAAVVDHGNQGENEQVEIVIDGKADDDSNGIVLVDGIDIRKMDVKYLRHSIALVGQEPVLFDASVKENISFAKENATEEEIISAAKTANAHDFISNFAGGYDYNVGSRGKKLSGGQKQRVSSLFVCLFVMITYNCLSYFLCYRLLSQELFSRNIAFFCLTRQHLHWITRARN